MAGLSGVAERIEHFLDEAGFDHVLKLAQAGNKKAVSALEKTALQLGRGIRMIDIHNLTAVAVVFIAGYFLPFLTSLVVSYARPFAPGRNILTLRPEHRPSTYWKPESQKGQETEATSIGRSSREVRGGRGRHG